MDARAMLPKGWHPQTFLLRGDGSFPGYGEALGRTQVGGVRYYFIDFGLATRGENSVVGVDGLIRSPELSDCVPYDPYKLDIFILGRLYQYMFLVVSSSQYCVTTRAYMLPFSSL